jgi:phosphate transport system substrate-binding protein
MTVPFERALMTGPLSHMDEWRRLSGTFRFKTGSATLENVSRCNPERLAAFIAGEGAGCEFRFVALTASDGSVEAKRKLAVVRATGMRNALQKFIDPALFETLKIDVKGSGEVNPVGCNTDFAGQRLSRRVEVRMRKGRCGPVPPGAGPVDLGRAGS